MIEIKFATLVSVLSVIWNVCSCTPFQETGSKVSVITSDGSSRPWYEEKKVKENETWNKIIQEYRRKRDLQDGDRTYDDFKTYLNLIDAKITKAENDIKEINRKLSNYEEIRYKEATNITTEINSLKTELPKLYLETDALHLKVTAIETENQETKKEVNELKAKVSELKNGKTEMTADITQLKNAIQKQRTNINDLKSTSSIMNVDNMKLNLEHDYVNNETINLRNEITEIELEVNNNAKEISLTKRKYGELEDQFQGNVKELIFSDRNGRAIKDMATNTEPIIKNRKKRTIEEDAEKYKDLITRLDANYNNIYNLINYTETILHKQKDYEKKSAGEAADTRFKIDQLKTDFSNIYSQITDFYSKLNDLETNKLETKEEFKEMKREVSELKTENTDIITEIKNDMNKLITDNNELQVLIIKLNTKTELLKQNYGNIKSDNMELAAQVTKLREKVTSLADEITSTNKKYEEMREQIRIRDEERNKLSHSTTKFPEEKNCESELLNNYTVSGLKEQIMLASLTGSWQNCIMFLKKSLCERSVAYEQVLDIKPNDVLPNVVANFGYMELLNILVRNGLEINEKFDGHHHILHRAAVNGRTDVLYYLITHGADIQVKTPDWFYTPLHSSAVHGRLDCARLLVAFGAEINPQTCEGNTPLHLAGQKGNVDIVKLLLKQKDCNKTIKNKKGQTAYDTAIENDHKLVAEILSNK